MTESTKQEIKTDLLNNIVHREFTAKYRSGEQEVNTNVASLEISEKYAQQLAGLESEFGWFSWLSESYMVNAY
jgi:hypothetical protein